MKRYLFICLLFPLLAVAQAASDNVITVYTSKPEFSIQVKTNPSSGSAWFIKQINDTLFQKIDKSMKRSRSKLFSTPSKKMFHFELKSHETYPASSEIFLFYAPTIDAKKGVLKKYKIKIIDDKNQ